MKLTSRTGHRGLQFLLLGILLAPYILLLGYGLRQLSLSPDNVSSTVAAWSFYAQDFFQVLLSSTVQALFSSCVSVFLGFWGALGLLATRAPVKKYLLQIYIMVPGLLPTLFIIIAGVNFVSWFFRFPYGIWGVVLLHVFVNVGVVAVGIERLIRSQYGRAFELAMVEGATRRQCLIVLLRGLAPQLRTLGFMVFALALTSFSIPLAIGAQSGSTLEILVYRGILSRGDLLFASCVAWFQLLLVGGISWWIYSAEVVAPDENSNYATLAAPSGLVALVVTTTVLLLANMVTLREGIQQMRRLWTSQAEFGGYFVQQVFGTFQQSFLVGFVVLTLMVVLLYLLQDEWLHSLLIGYLAPSAVLIGFVFYFSFDLQSSASSLVLVALSLAFALSVLPSVYRLRMANVIYSLRGQVQVARVMGASPSQIAAEILLPQTGRDIFFIAGLAALWASGDFALSSVLTGRQLTLGLAVKNLMSGYRIELATVYVLVALLIGAILFFIFERCGRVFDTKFNT